MTRRVDDPIAYFWSKVDQRGPDECWEWGGLKAGNGYGMLNTRLARRLGLPAGAHRYSYQLSIGRIPKGSLVCHHCDNRMCVNPAHLFLGSHADNMLDMLAKGRSSRGERNAHTRLTSEDVQAIREVYAAGGATMKAIGQRYGVSKSCVHRVVRGITWRHTLEKETA